VVIPAYNESQNFRDGLLGPPVDYLQKAKFSYEVILVNDGSTDDTKELLESFVRKMVRLGRNFKLLTIKHGGKAMAVTAGMLEAKGDFVLFTDFDQSTGGKAMAVTAGMLEAKGDYVLFTDFDQSTPLYQVERFLEEHKNGADIVIGDRDVLKMNNKLLRRFRSWVFLMLVQTVLLPGIRDSQCGFKSFSNSYAKKIFNNLSVSRTGKVTGGYMGAFDVEVLFLGLKLGAKTEQVTVVWDKVEGKRLNPVMEPLKMIRDVFKVRIFDLIGKYDHLSNTAKN